MGIAGKEFAEGLETVGSHRKPGSSSSHQKMTNGRCAVSVPDHGDRDLGAGLLGQLLKDAGLSAEGENLASFSRFGFRKLRKQSGKNGKQGEIMTVTYPAILHPDTNNTYWVEFPDLPGCLTYGDTVDEAACYAADALSVFLCGESLPFPVPSDADGLRSRHGIVRLVTAEVEPRIAREAI